MAQPLKYITGLLPCEFESEIIKIGLEKYRAKQLLHWVYKKHVFDFDLMTDIPKDLIQKITSSFKVLSVDVVADATADDGTCKRLLKMDDGAFIESVWLPRRRHAAVCLSTQAGCPARCLFCATGQMGFVRNLTSSEIVSELLITPSEESFASHAVFMGMGEPFLNYDNVIKAIKIINHPYAGNIGARRITISTAGIIDGIKRLANENMQIELAVSLHSADNALRTKIVPLNKKHPLKELISVCREYTKKTNRQITFEYVLLKGVNDSMRDAELLSKLIKGLLCKVNLIGFNEIQGSPEFKKPSYQTIQQFAHKLKTNKIPTTIRASQGAQIQAGCGQLKAKITSPS